MEEVIVHVDFKGLPLSPEHLCEVLAALKSKGATGVLLEWEDVFPYSGTLQCLGRAEAGYSPDEVRRVLEAALALGLEVIPLVQTVGHLEFALKHDTFAALREDPDDYGTLCPVLQDSHVFIKELINQVAQLHLHSTRMHIGCDEPTLGVSAQTSAAAAADVDGLAGVLAEYVCSTCAALSDVGAGRSLRALMWHDAAVSMPEGCLERLLSSGVRCVCWDYTSLDYPDRPAVAFAERLQRRGAAPYIATAYKGGDASDAVVPNRAVRHDNQLAWRSWAQRSGANSLSGVVLTGWSRFGHLAPLTEMLPAGWSTLSEALQLWSGSHERQDALAASPLDELYARLNAHCEQVGAARTALEALEKEWKNNTRPATIREPSPKFVNTVRAKALILSSELAGLELSCSLQLEDAAVFRCKRDVAEWIECKVREARMRAEAISEQSRMRVEPLEAVCASRQSAFSALA